MTDLQTRSREAITSSHFGHRLWPGGSFGRTTGAGASAGPLASPPAPAPTAAISPALSAIAAQAPKCIFESELAVSEMDFLIRNSEMDFLPSSRPSPRLRKESCSSGEGTVEMTTR